MALTNNTKFRRSTLTITKRVNGVVDTAGGFPLTVSILNGFTDPATATVYATITSQDFSTLTDAAYNARLTAFYNYLENQYSFFNRNSVINVANGTDAVVCPLNNTVALIPGIQSIQLDFIALTGTLEPSSLAWTIFLEAGATVDLNYSFMVQVNDSGGNALKQILVSGIIPAGVTSYNSYTVDGRAIYIEEAESPTFTPVAVNVVPGSESLSF